MEACPELWFLSHEFCCAWNSSSLWGWWNPGLFTKNYFSSLSSAWEKVGRLVSDTMFYSSPRADHWHCNRLEYVWVFTTTRTPTCDLWMSKWMSRPCTVMTSNPQLFWHSRSDEEVKTHLSAWCHTNSQQARSFFQRLKLINHRVKMSRGAEQMILSARDR